MKEITRRQEKVLDTIKQFIEENEYPPTLAEIGEEIGITRSGVQGHLDQLEKKGYISMTPGRSRSVVIL